MVRDHALGWCAERCIKAGLAVLVPLDADHLLGGKAHDLTDPNVVDHVLRLAWSGTIGFAARAPPCSDQHMGFLENMEPWQLYDFQTSRLVHQNVIAILTAVHATGCHVLWENPPSSIATNLGFPFQHSHVLAMGGRMSV